MLPIFPGLSDAEQDHVIDRLGERLTAAAA
jgi:hypothetical protein